jgi:hypothetical protein
VIFSGLFGLRDARKNGERRPIQAGPVAGKVFVLAGGGLRHMGRRAERNAGRNAGHNAERGGSAFFEQDFLGYGTEDLFWKDVLDLVHPDEADGFRALISDLVRSPGASVSVKLRMLDASGRWRWTDACVQNVLEAPDGADGGLLIVNVRDLSPGDEGF